MSDMSKFKVAKSFKHLDPNKGLADGIAAGFSSIRYKGKSWVLSHGGNTYPFKRDDDGSPLTYIDLIILGISPGLSKVYFGEWNDDNASGPICASLKGDVPDPGVSIPQSSSCGICSHNEWITKPGGGRGKECQDHKRMAVLLMPSMTKKMLGTPLMEPVHLKIPPGSLKSLKKFSDELQSEGIPYAAVVTRVAFSQDRLFEMTFTVIQALTDAEAPQVLPMMESQQTRTIMGSMPDMREIAAPVRERVDTGLMEAFGGMGSNGAAEKGKGRGRPAGVPNKPKAPVIEHETAPPPPPPKAAEAKDEAAPAEEEWEESDTDIDATVIKMMGDKASKMMK